MRTGRRTLPQRARMRSPFGAQPEIASFALYPSASRFFLKTHYPDNKIVGGGFFSGFASLTISEAWAIYGTANGAATLEEMRARVGRYRRTPLASVIVAQAVGGETVTITDRGRPVAQLTAVPASPLQRMLDAGRGRPALHDVTDLTAPEPGPLLSAELSAMRDDERF